MDFEDGSAPEHFFLGDIRNTDGTPWECCPREFLRRAIAALHAARRHSVGGGIRTGVCLHRQSSTAPMATPIA